MNLHTLKKSKGSHQSRKRVGRGKGSGLGKTSGKGQKGQMSRSGHKKKPGFEGGQMKMIRRLPKRGFTNPTRKEFIPVNVEALARFDEGSTVDIETLKAAGLANQIDTGVKILGRGDLAKKLTVKADAFSASAKTKIEGAGGSCEVVTASGSPSIDEVA